MVRRTHSSGGHELARTKQGGPTSDKVGIRLYGGIRAGKRTRRRHTHIYTLVGKKTIFFGELSDCVQINVILLSDSPVCRSESSLEESS